MQHYFLRDYFKGLFALKKKKYPLTSSRLKGDATLQLGVGLITFFFGNSNAFLKTCTAY